MWQLLLNEFSRAVLAMIAPVVWAGVWSGDNMLSMLVTMMGIFVLGYVTCTFVVFSVAPHGQIIRWATRQRGTLLRRYIWMSEPGGGLALYFSLAALLGVLAVLPDRDWDQGGSQVAFEMAAVVATVFFAWLAIAMTQALDYLASHQRLGADALEFPGTPDPRFHDYLYLAMSISATFGTTDVSIRTGVIRRRVTMHSLIAFVFNTVILATVVTMVGNRIG